MTLQEVVWHEPVNVLLIRCDCGTWFFWWSNVSVAQCPKCGRAELWHSVDPKPESGPWSLPVMEYGLREPE